jgi:hypothetical protein
MDVQSGPHASLNNSSAIDSIMVFLANLFSSRNPIFPSPSMGEGVKKLEFAPSPYPLPVGERVNFLNL